MVWNTKPENLAFVLWLVLLLSVFPTFAQASKCTGFRYQQCQTDRDCQSGERCQSVPGDCPPNSCQCDPLTGKTTNCSKSCTANRGVCVRLQCSSADVQTLASPVSTMQVHASTQAYKLGVRMYTFVTSFREHGTCPRPGKGKPSLSKQYKELCHNLPDRARSCSEDRSVPAGMVTSSYCRRCCNQARCSFPNGHSCKSPPWNTGAGQNCEQNCLNWCRTTGPKVFDCLGTQGSLLRLGTGYSRSKTGSFSSAPTVLQKVEYATLLLSQSKRRMFAYIPGTDVRTLPTNNRPLLASLTPDNATLPTSVSGDVPDLKYRFDDKNNLLTAAMLGIDGCATGNKAQCKQERKTVIEILRGRDGKGLRKRSHLLGALRHSRPVVVGPPTLNVSHKSYKQWLAGNGGALRKRPTVVYVGSNSGMLHAFLADVEPGSGLVELWSYLPQTTLTRLRKVIDGADSPGGPVPTVDATPLVQNVQMYRYVDGSKAVQTRWRTVLVSGLGQGGRGYFALDITDPYKPRLLWEIHHKTHKNPLNTTLGTFSKLGYTTGKPLLINALLRWDGRLQERTLAILPGGVALEEHSRHPTRRLKASMLGNVVYAVDLETGRFVREWTLASPTEGIDVSKAVSAGIVAALPVHSPTLSSRFFAGDVKGRLFRMDLQSQHPCRLGESPSVCQGSADATGWTTRLFYNLFVAGTPQPLMVQPAISTNAAGEWVLLGGTGDLTRLQRGGSTNVIFSLREVMPTSNTGKTLNPALIKAVPNFVTPLNRLRSKTPAGLPGATTTSTKPTGEKLTATPILYAGIAYWTTHLPDQTTQPPQCWVEGTARVYGVHFNDPCQTQNCWKKLKLANKTSASVTPLLCCEQGAASKGTCASSNNAPWSDAQRILKPQLCAALSYTQPRLQDYRVTPTQWYRFWDLGSRTLSMGTQLSIHPGEVDIRHLNPGKANRGHLVQVLRKTRRYLSFSLSGTPNAAAIGLMSRQFPALGASVLEPAFLRTLLVHPIYPEVRIGSWAEVLD